MKNELAKKLASYSTMAGAALLATKNSDAQIVFTDINDTIIYSDCGLDLNNDDTIDFFIDQEWYGEFSAVKITPGYYEVNSAICSTNSSPLLPYALNFLDPINSIQQVGLGSGILTCSFPDFPGKWGGVFNHYLGLEFHVGATHFFGWARLSVANNARHFTIKDYAYNSTPGMQILAGDEGCSDNFEPNNFKLQATSIQPNTLVRAQIASASDEDWYSFSISGIQNNARIILSSLLFNYNIKLFDHNGNFLAKSGNPGARNDTIIYNGLAPISYYIKVFGHNGNFNAVDCYSLIVETSANPFKEVWQQNPDGEQSTLSIFPNPVSSISNIQFSFNKSSEVKIELFDLQGKKIKTIADGNFEAGDHQLILQKENLTAGVYFLQLKTENGVAIKKLLVE